MTVSLTSLALGTIFATVLKGGSVQKLFELFHGFTAKVSGLTVSLTCPCGKKTFKFRCTCPAYPTVRSAGCPVHYPNISFSVLRALWSIGQLKRLNCGEREKARLSCIFKRGHDHTRHDEPAQSTHASLSVPNCS